MAYELDPIKVVIQLRSTQADLLAIRSWLALEQGRIDHAREYGQRAMDAVVLSRDREGVTSFFQFPGYGLTQYCGYLMLLNRR